MLRLPEFFDSILMQQKLKTNVRKNLGFVTITTHFIHGCFINFNKRLRTTHP